MMKLKSDAFEDGEQIPMRYTKDGENVSPPLRWSDLPSRTASLALVFENITPETKEPFVQWLIYGIDASSDGLPEGFKHAAEPEEPAAVLQGKNDLDNVGYDGPLGTIGKEVRFRFRLWALDRDIDLPAGEERALVDKLERHDLARAELHVVHERRP